MTDSERIMEFIDYPHCEDIYQYINYVRRADFDVVVFMARKMYCLYMAADKVCQNLSDSRENRLVIQHNALPFFKEKLVGKRVLLCDDIALSATAIKTHRKLLIDEYSVHPDNIMISILFAKEGLNFDFPMDRTPIFLEYGKVREISQAIVSFIWSAMITYVAYLPSYDASIEWLSIIQDKYNELSDKWEQQMITLEYNPLSRLRSFCFSPKEPRGKAQFACVRMYYNEDGNKITIVPFVVIPPISLDSLHRVYDKCGHIFGFPITSDSSDQMDAAKYRLINYIFSGEVYSRFLNDFSIDGTKFEYRDTPDAYSFPASFARLGSKLLDFKDWDELWALVESAPISDSLESYVNANTTRNDEGIDHTEVINALESSGSAWRFFGAMSQYDKKTAVFSKGVSETALRKVVKPSNLSAYFALLISYLDGAIATMNTHINEKIAYCYLQKGEQACSVFQKKAAISTSALSLIYRTIGVEQWERHEDTILAIYKAYGEKKSDAVLDDYLLNILLRTGIDGFYLGHYYDLYQKYGEERSDEVEYFTCFSRLFPEYLNQNQIDDSSVNGFTKFLQDSYPDDDMIKSFVQEVAIYAI